MFVSQLKFRLRLLLIFKIIGRESIAASFQLRRKNKFLFIKVLGPMAGYCYFWSLSKLPI